MRRKIDLAGILAKNPKIDPKKIVEVQRMLQELRKAGIEPVRYNLVPPFSRLLSDPEDRTKADEDPRMIHLIA